MDIRLQGNGDLYLGSMDLEFTESVRQKIGIRLRWFLGEWRWKPEEGLPYWDEIFVKNPDTDIIEAAVRSKIFEVVEVTAVKDVTATLNAATREMLLSFTAITDDEVIREEMKISG